MKIAGYIFLGIVALIAMGVVTLLVMSNMSGADRMAGAIDIAKPSQVVWKYVDEPEKLKSWISWVVEVRDETPGKRGIGSRRVMVMEDRNNGNMRMDIAGEVVAYEEGRRSTVRLSSPGMFSGENSYTLQDLGNGQTRLMQESRFHFDNWFARLMSPLVMSAARKKMVEDLQRLKSVVEQAS